MEISTIELSSPAGFPFSSRRDDIKMNCTANNGFIRPNKFAFDCISISSILQKRQYLNDAPTGLNYSRVNRRQRRNVNNFYLYGQRNGSAHPSFRYALCMLLSLILLPGVPLLMDQPWIADFFREFRINLSTKTSNRFVAKESCYLNSAESTVYEIKKRMRSYLFTFRKFCLLNTIYL